MGYQLQEVWEEVRLKQIQSIQEQIPVNVTQIL